MISTILLFGIGAEKRLQRGIKFLASLKKNNNREWFQEHKSEFENYVQAPALSFVVDFGERIKVISPGLTYDTAKNGSGSLMRIYRDTRFSKDKTPYKTHVGMVFWEGGLKKTENPSYWVGFDPDGGRMYVGQHVFPREVLAAYREAVDDKSMAGKLENAIEAVNKNGDNEVGGEHYKSVPRGYDADHVRQELLRYNGLWAKSPTIDTKWLSSADVLDLFFEQAVELAPIHKWLVELNKQA